MKDEANETALTANGVKLVLCTKNAVTAASNKPTHTPFVLARLVKIPSANIPAIGTPNKPVISKNKFHVSARFVETRYKAATIPNKPATTIEALAKCTSLLPSLLP